MKYILTTLVALFSLSANAQFLDKINFSMGTDLPLQLGAKAKYNFSPQMYGEFGLGYLPDFYAGLMDTFLFGITDGEKEVMSESIGGSFVLNFGGGYRFSGAYRPYVSAHYTYITGGKGQATGVQMNNFLYDIKAFWPYPPIQISNAFDVKSDLSAFTFKAGMEYRISPQLIFGLEAGLVKPISASSKVDNQLLDALPKFDMERFLNNSWKDSFILTIGVWAKLTL